MPEEFFVGYLPIPPKLRRSLIVLASSFTLLVCVFGICIAALQRDPGPGHWNLDQLDTFDGVLVERPYPMLQTEHGTLLLVAEGKRGAVQRVAGMNGRRITLHGHTLTRGELHLLELDDTAPATSSAPSSTPPSILSTEMITLTGEIIDPKCFSGAMKPGEGKTHKACAILCIRGGIPPAFLKSDGSTLLLVNAQGEALSGDALEATLPYVGDLVHVEGRTGNAGGIATLYIQSIARR